MSKVGLGAAIAACAIAMVLISAVALAGIETNIGTTNGVHYTLGNNVENLIVTDDPILVSEFSRRFEMLWNKWSKT